jgi:amino acid transporter
LGVDKIQPLQAENTPFTPFPFFEARATLFEKNHGGMPKGRGFKLKRILTISVAMGLLVSPETLTALGNSVGKTGQGFVGFVLLAGVIHLLTTLAYDTTSALYPGPSGEARLIRKAFGAVAAVVSPVCARVTTAVFASSALLATAGYAFNEVFLYWFPNLEFSFCLLGFLLLLNLAGENAAAIGQLVFVGLAVGGLLLLSLVGFWEWGNPPPTIQETPSPLAHVQQAGLASLLVFVGFDLAHFAGETPDNPAKAMMYAILLAGLVFCCWGWISVKYVPSSSLAETSIPYVKAARAVLGQWGRILMGLIVLTGSAAAVNALLMGVSRMIAAMTADGLLPSFLAKGKNEATIGLLLLTAAVAAMIGSGMAGEPILETYIKAGIWFWLLHYAVLHGAVFLVAAQTRQGSVSRSWLGHWVLTFPGLAAMVLALTGMLLLERDWHRLFEVSLVLFGIVLGLSSFWIALSRKKGWLTQLQSTTTRETGGLDFPQ